MKRLEQVTELAKINCKKLLIPYLVAGDPNLVTSLALMHALVEAGADVLELGIPFSDPSSDGPVIQRGAERSLAQGTTLGDVLALTSSFRETNTATPVVLMGYLNPIEIMGYEEFAQRAASAGVDGVLIVDMPPAEASELAPLLHQVNLDMIFLVSPTTPVQRAETIAGHSSGYLYYVSLKGVTGAALTDYKSVEKNIQQLRELTELPVVIGFGIRDETSARAMADLADGVVIGSALVAKIADLPDQDEQSAEALQQTVEFIAQVRYIINNIN
ncbi:MAG: tryptophan synthase subunit alpha [Gammaproteobacteria bacterium]|jgi:tryptophan synthase alpha chain|nr:tryptophan synthase subunit alpha [Gammaproteobacteria bacterium]MDP6097598.1 tryptophan synthase subunit alpha [Gammaproteobacteria bacterium]